MLKRVTILVVMALAALGAHAVSPVEWGVVTGGNYLNMNDKWVDICSMAGFHGGLSVRVNMPKMYLQPEIIYMRNSYDFSSRYYSSYYLTTRVRLSMVRVPIMAGVKVLGAVRLFAGPVLTLMADGKMSDTKAHMLETGHHGESVLTKWPTIGYMAGAGVDLPAGLSLSLRYNGEFSRQENIIEYNGNTIIADGSASVWMLSAGFYF